MSSQHLWHMVNDTGDYEAWSWNLMRALLSNVRNHWTKLAHCKNETVPKNKIMPKKSKNGQSLKLIKRSHILIAKMRSCWKR